MARSRFSMRDVARLADASVATVSAVINGTANVSPKTLKKVRDAMQALDYHPDQVARSLKSGRTLVIGMVIPDISNAFYPEVICGVEEEARQSGYSVILCNSNEDPLQERRNVEMLFSRRVDGILIACSGPFTEYAAPGSRRVATVFVDRLPECSADGVSTDNIHAGYIAARHLIELGHERIAIITGDLSLSPHAHRVEGVRRAMQEAGIPLPEDYIVSSGGQSERGYLAAVDLIGLVRPPTAIVSSNNKALFGVMRAFRERQIPCPGGISVIGFDDFAWTEHYTPRITVVAQQTREMGRRAVAALLSRMREPEDAQERKPEKLLLKARLVVRNSTAPPPRDP